MHLQTLSTKTPNLPDRKDDRGRLRINNEGLRVHVDPFFSNLPKKLGSYIGRTLHNVPVRQKSSTDRPSLRANGRDQVTRRKSRPKERLLFLTDLHPRQVRTHIRGPEPRVTPHDRPTDLRPLLPREAPNKEVPSEHVFPAVGTGFGDILVSLLSHVRRVAHGVSGLFSRVK